MFILPGLFLLDFTKLFLSVFFKLLESFGQAFYCSFKLCVLKLVWVILIGKYFCRTDRLCREDTGLIFHTVTLLMRYGHVGILCSEFVMDKVSWGKEEV